MNPTEIAAAWKRSFGDAVPLGHVCRQMLPERWVRIHSLPESRRYPEDEEDFRELLSRHNTVATAVLGEGEQCVLFVVVFDDHAVTVTPSDLPGVDAETFVQVPELAGTVEETGLLANVTAAPTMWQRYAFDDVLRAVAEDRAPALWANLRRGTAYAPYDGGADVFVSSPEAVGPSRTAWRDWLSQRVDGL